MSDKQPVPTFKVFFLQEKSDESYSSKLLLNLREILKDDRSPYEHEGLQTISGSYGDNEIKIDVVSRCSTAFARLSNDTYDLIILPVHGSCFTSELERYCKESDKTAFADKIIIREVGDLVKWETREKNYPINSVKAKDVIYINVVEDEDDLLLNTIIGFFGKIEININFDKDFNSDKIDKINSTLLGISPFISTRPQPKSDLGKDVAIQIMSHSSSEKTSMVDVDGCTIYLNCSKSVVRFTKSVIAKFSKKFTGEPSETTANYDQLSKEIIGLIDHKSLELFHSALSRPEAEKIIELKPENPELEKYHSYYKDQLGEIKNLVVEGIDSEKRVQIQNILDRKSVV